MQVPGYRDLTVLGRGGFSTVYRAVQESVQRDVALKVLAVHMAGADAKARFRRECATNGRVGTHPNIVTLFDSGFADDGSPFLAMQLCSGGSLSERLRSTGPLPVADVLRVGVKISAALQYAHSAGVLHRDIKPENILMTEFGEPELADFGISSVDDQRMSTVTASSFTINHAAPEALSGQPSSVSTDVYSLCSTLFTLLAGRAPFAMPNTASIYAVVHKVMNDPPPPTGRSDVPESLERLLAAGLSKTPEGRPADAKAVGSALQRIQHELGLSVTEFPSAPPPLTSSPTQMLTGLGSAPSGPPPPGGRPIDTGALPPTGAMPRTGAMPPTGAVPRTGAMPQAGAVPGTGVRSGPAGHSATRQWVAAGAGATAPVDSYQPPPADPRAAGGPPPRPDRRAWWVVGIAVLVLLIAAGIYAVARTGGTSAGPTASSTSSRPNAASSASTRPSTSGRTSSAASTKSSPPSTSRSSSSSSSSAAALVPAITSFGSSEIPIGGSVACTSTTDRVDVPLVWSSSNAVKAWTGIDVTSGDASTSPYNPDGVPVNASNQTLPFACSAEKHTFMLTVQGASGNRVSKSVTFTRQLAETSSSQTSTSSSDSTTPSTSSSQTSTSPTTSSTSSAPTTATSSSTSKPATTAPAS